MLEIEAAKQKSEREEMERVAAERRRRREGDLARQLEERKAELEEQLQPGGRGWRETGNRGMGLEHFRYYQLARMSKVELFKLSHWTRGQRGFRPSHAEIQAELLPRLRGVYSQVDERTQTRVKQYFDPRYTRLGPATELVGLLSSVKLDWKLFNSQVSDNISPVSLR